MDIENKKEMFSLVRATVKEGRGGFVPFNLMTPKLVIFLKQKNYAVQAVRDQEVYWYKPFKTLRAQRAANGGRSVRDIVAN